MPSWSNYTFIIIGLITNQLWKIKNTIAIPNVVAGADPGFPVGGVDPFWVGVDLWHRHFWWKYVWKRKNWVPCGGMHQKILYVSSPMHGARWLHKISNKINHFHCGKLIAIRCSYFHSSCYLPTQNQYVFYVMLTTLCAVILGGVAIAYVMVWRHLSGDKFDVQEPVETHMSMEQVLILNVSYIFLDLLSPGN